MGRSRLFAAALLSLLAAACSAPDQPTVPLYLAVQRGDLEQLDRHLHWGSDINAALPGGLYPLQAAAELGRQVMVQRLLKHGADIAATDAEGRTALDRSVLAGRTRVAEILLQHGASLEPSALLLQAAESDSMNRDTVRFLIEQGADTEQRNAAGDTPLLIAIRHGNHRLATHLLDQGADFNATTADGKTALELAGELGASELVSMLQRLGAR
jgi:ankyrin repeat protein